MSEAKRFFIDGKVDTIATIVGSEFNHAVNVMRLRIGDEVVLCNGDGCDYNGKVKTIAKKDLTIEINKKTKNCAEPHIDVTLFQALCKGERMELIAQKCNELGVNHLVPFVSKFTTVKQDTNKAERMAKIVAESAKQCGRACRMEVTSVLTFEKVLCELKKYDRIIIAYEQSPDGSLVDALNGVKGRVALIVGSEGGFDREEVDAIASQGARVVTMGTRILRAETAAIALVSSTMCLLGEWQR